ncbi:Uncharacterized protein PBTT_02572 [Plasmodiophora brassicae]|uniref:Uncharacterized protein n=1 Tax=Plasmodiophora brassicae TaxID=37360 RepID=A0A0G4ISK3_PLABS|nr:hypothetical protein PBRA_006311 [Plasmodiophora brassicae]SPQ95234.1 unnamed protein product [Plasmodiophora brassicae]
MSTAASLLGAVASTLRARVQYAAVVRCRHGPAAVSVRLLSSVASGRHASADKPNETKVFYLLVDADRTPLNPADQAKTVSLATSETVAAFRKKIWTESSVLQKFQMDQLQVCTSAQQSVYVKMELPVTSLRSSSFWPILVIIPRIRTILVQVPNPDPLAKDDAFESVVIASDDDLKRYLKGKGTALVKIKEPTLKVTSMRHLKDNARYVVYTRNTSYMAPRMGEKKPKTPQFRRNR